MKTLIILVGLINTMGVEAVNLSTDGSGEVLLYPYYTVKGGFDTHYSVVNNSEDAKVIKVRFREGVNLVPVYQFNVYLSPRDVWTGVLSRVAPTDPGQEDGVGVLHSSQDMSCVPFMNKQGEEFNVNDVPDTDTNQSIDRVTEGLIEVIEMGTVTGSSAAALQQDGTGEPIACDLLETAWSAAGYWTLDGSVDLALPSGQLSGKGVMLDVLSGQMVAYDAVALNDFWAADGSHTQPDEVLPNLNDAAPASVVQTSNGYATGTWTDGYQAVSAVLMKTALHNQYNIEPIISAQTDWVISWPTKAFHTNPELSMAQTPYTNLWNGEAACESFTISRTDVDALSAVPLQLEACEAISIIGIKGEFGGLGIFQSYASNDVLIAQDNPNSQNGWAAVTFNGAQQHLFDNNGQGLLGLPAIGFAVQKYINAGAAQGILSIYTELADHRYVVNSIEDFIFADGFDDEP